MGARIVILISQEMMLIYGAVIFIVVKDCLAQVAYLDMLWLVENVLMKKIA